MMPCEFFRSIMGFCIWMMVLMQLPAATLVVDFSSTPSLTVEYDSIRIIVSQVDVVDGYLQKIEKVSDRTVRGRDARMTIENLTPSRYLVTAHTGRPELINDADRPGAFIDSAIIDLTAQSQASIRFVYEPFDCSDLSEFRGAATLTGRLYDWSGEPLSGRQLDATAYQPGYGFAAIAKAITDANGAFQFDGLNEAESYQIRAAQNLVYYADLTQVSDIAITLKPEVGEPAPDFSFFSLDSETTATLSSLRGRIIVLDFWATWCAPCQPHLTRMNKWRDSHPDWEGRVVLLPMSLDDDLGELRQHVTQKGWQRLTHGWLTNPRDQRVYVPGKTGIPETYIITADGRIAHISPSNPEALVDELLAMQQEKE